MEAGNSSAPVGRHCPGSCVGGIFLVLYKLIAPVLKREQVTGGEGMIGLEGRVVTPLTPEGVIKVRGELWKAYSTDASISADEEVIVVELEGLKLLVKRKDVEIIPGTGRANHGGST